MGATPGSPDYPSYHLMYNGIIVSKEPLFQSLIDLCNFLNLPYEMFRLICIFISLTLINQTVKKVINKRFIKYYYVIYLFLPISLFMDSGLLRNFMANSIFIYAIPYLLNNNLVNTFKYVFLIIIASMFQIIVLAYLPLALLRYVIKNKYLHLIYRISLFIASILIIVRPVFDYFIRDTIILWVSLYMPRAINYVSVKGRYGAYFMFELQILIVYFMYLSYKYLKQKLNVGYRDLEYTKMIYIFTMYLLITSPLLIFEYTFIRITRNFLPLIIMTFVVLIFQNRLIKQKKWKLIAVFMLIYIQFFILDFRINLISLSIGESDSLLKFLTENPILYYKYF